jgi:hypothetical protein
MKTACYAFVVFLLFAGCERNGGIPADKDCIANLKQLETAKEQWAIENRKTTNDAPTMAEVTPFLRESRSCRSGGVYTLGRVGEKPRCSIKGHELP